MVYWFTICNAKRAVTNYYQYCWRLCFVFCVAYEYSWQYVGYLVFSFGVVVVVVCACFWQYAIGDVLAMLSDHQERFV